LQEKETTKANGQGCCRALNRTKSKRGVFLGFFLQRCYRRSTLGPQRVWDFELGIQQL